MNVTSIRIIVYEKRIGKRSMENRSEKNESKVKIMVENFIPFPSSRVVGDMIFMMLYLINIRYPPYRCMMYLN